MCDNDKGRRRSLALSRRNGLDEDFRRRASSLICQRLLSLEEVEKAGTVMLYRSFRSEVMTDEIVENLYARGKKLCFPLCEKAGIMRAWSPNEESSWKKGYMGIIEPDPEKSRLIAPEDIELVICPMAAFDEKRARMGYGGGYYDRYLPLCTKALRVGIAFEAQREAQIITEATDIPMDMVVTEEKIY